MQIGLGGVKLGSASSGHSWRADVRLVHEAVDRGVDAVRHRRRLRVGSERAGPRASAGRTPVAGDDRHQGWLPVPPANARRAVRSTARRRGSSRRSAGDERPSRGPRRRGGCLRPAGLLARLPAARRGGEPAPSAHRPHRRVPAARAARGAARAVRRRCGDLVRDGQGRPLRRRCRERRRGGGLDPGARRRRRAAAVRCPRPGGRRRRRRRPPRHTASRSGLVGCSEAGSSTPASATPPSTTRSCR